MVVVIKEIRSTRYAEKVIQKATNVHTYTHVHLHKHVHVQHVQKIPLHEHVTTLLVAPDWTNIASCC